MKASSVFLVFAGSYLFLVMLNDGTVPAAVNNAASFVKTIAGGIRPITKVA